MLNVDRVERQHLHRDARVKSARDGSLIWHFVPPTHQNATHSIVLTVLTFDLQNLLLIYFIASFNSQTGKIQMSPLIVYLDTSDFRNLSVANERGTGDPHFEILDWLRSEIRNKRIEIRFSLVHVAELTRHASARKLSAVTDCKFMRVFSNNETLTSPAELFDLELKSALVGLSLERRFCLSQNGRWCGDVLPDFRDLRKSARTGIKKVIADQNLDRSTRRRLLNEIVGRDGVITAKGMSLIRDNRTKNLFSELAAQYPLTEKFYSEDVFDKVLTGAISIRQFYNELMSGLLRPDNIVSAYAEMRPAEFEGIFSFVREFGAKILSIRSEIRDDLRGIPTIYLRPKQKLVAAIERATPFGKIAVRMARELSEQFAALEEAKAMRAIESCRSLVALDALAVLVTREFMKNPDWNPEGSIGADLMHAAYIPYVDVWRGDRSFCALLKKQRIFETNHVVPKLSQLRSVIEGIQLVNTA